MNGLVRFLFGAAVATAASGLALAAPFAYVTGWDQVAVVDLATNAVVDRIGVGRQAYGVAVDVPTNRIYVTSMRDSSVSVINGETNRVIATVAVGVLPGHIAVSSSAGRAYVANESDSTVSIIDTATFKVVATVPVGRKPLGVTADSSGTRVYVANADSDTVSVIDTASNAVVATVPAPGHPVSLVVNPAGTRLYVTNFNAAAVTVIDTATHAIVASVPLSSVSTLPPSVPSYFAYPEGMAIDAAGTRLYLTHPQLGIVSIVDTTRNILLDAVKVRPFPSYVRGVSVEPTGRYVYVTDGNSDAFVVMDSLTNLVIATISVGFTPAAIGPFIGPGPTVPGEPATVVEFYNRALDHYFITWMPREIADLDAGTQSRGWTRTRYSFKTYTNSRTATSPVCRYYIPPALGDSHFFGRGAVECSATGVANPSFVLESPDFMHSTLPASGVCPTNTIPVYRVFSNRSDANHRYLTDRSVRDQMVAKGWLAEGDGPDLIAMCAPQ